MINHSIQSMNLDQYDEGEIYLPSETKSAPFESNLRQFIILTRRAYNEEALIEMQGSEGIKLTQRSSLDESSPYFGLTLRATALNNTIEDFVEDYGDDFFASILRIVSTSTQRGISGKRAVFVREFRRFGVVDSDTIETQIVVSSSIFYNDYRVTTGFPADQYELSHDMQSILARLQNEWGDHLAIALNGHLNPYKESDNDFDF